MDIKDLKQIKEIVKEAVREEDLATKKDLQKIDKKFDKLFDFIDKDLIKTKRDVREIQSHLHLPISTN